MTVAALASSINYIENGVTLAFAAPFRFLAGSISVSRVLVDGTVVDLAAGVDFSTSGGATDAGGTVTLVSSVAGATLRIRRSTARVQAMDYTPGDRFPAESHEAAIDRAMLIDQEQDVAIADIGARALRVPDGETVGVLPKASLRVGLAGWDGSGNLYGTELPAQLAAATTITVPSKAVMAALASPVAGNVVFLASNSDPSHWVTRAGVPPTDLLQGLYVQSATAGFYYERVWDRTHGRPEWFGAVTNDPGTDCLAALVACVALCPTTLLSVGDYWTSAKWKVDTNWRKIIGAGRIAYNGATEGTRVLLASGSATIFQIGPDANPGGNPGVTYRRGVEVSGIQFTRAATIVPNAVAANSAVGVRMQYCYDCKLDRTASWESAIGYQFYGVVTCFIDDNFAHRDSNATTTVNDIAYGFHCIGDPPILAGGNASIHLSRCIAEIPNSGIPSSSGFELVGAFVDSFLDRCETVYAKTSCHIAGVGADTTAGKNIDLILRGCRFDQPYENGVKIESLNRSAMVEIDDLYVGLPATGFAALFLTTGSGGGGNITVKGGNLIGFTGGSSIGLYVNGQGGVDVKGLKIQNFPRACILDTATDFDVDLQINNQDVSSWNGASATAAIFMNACTRGVVAASIKGKANAFAQGINMNGTGNTLCEIRATKINPACINGGANNKLLHNAVQITAAGAFGTNNLAQGIML